MSRYTTPDAVRALVQPDLQGVDTSEETGGQLDDEQLWVMIEQASARIEQYIGARYQTPVAALTTPYSPDDSPATGYPTPIGEWCRALAAYEATLTLYRSMPMPSNDPAFLRMTSVMTDLQSIQSGKGVLQLPEPSSGETVTGVGYAGVVTQCDVFDPFDWGVRPASGALAGMWGWDGC